MDAFYGSIASNRPRYLIYAICVIGLLFRDIQVHGQDLTTRIPELSLAPSFDTADSMPLYGLGEMIGGEIEPTDEHVATELSNDEGYNEAEQEVESDSDDEEQEAESDDGGEADDSEDLSTLLGERLHQVGPVTAEFIYAGQLHTNAHGGISTKKATRYRGNLDVLLSIDTGSADWWQGGTFFAYVHQSHGRTLSADFVGDAQFYNNFDTSPKGADLTQLGEYWYQHRFGEERLSIKLGRQDANADFAFSDLGGDFVNSSFLTLPNIPLPTWPTQTMGVSSLLQVNDKLRIGGGAYDQGRDIGQFWSTTVSRGMFYIGQADYQPFVDIDDSKLTILRFGSWFSSSDSEALDGGSVFGDNFGFYTTLDRMLFVESQDAGQGLGAFFQYSWAPASRNQLTNNYGAGVLYRGLLPNRDADTIGLGFSLVEFSSIVKASTGQTSENAVELFYKAQVRSWLTIQPDLQYIARPNGIEKDAFLVGLNFEVAL